MSSAALLGGVFIGVLSALPIVNIANCCCLWVTGGGVLTVYLAQGTGRPIGPGRGAWLGFFAGVIGAVVWLVAFAALDVVVGPMQQRLIEAMLDRSIDMPPDARQMLEAISARSASPLRYVLGFLFQFLAGALFSTLGGLIGAIFLRKAGDINGREQADC